MLTIRNNGKYTTVSHQANPAKTKYYKQKPVVLENKTSVLRQNGLPKMSTSYCFIESQDDTERKQEEE